MTNLLLYGMTGAIPVIAIAGLAAHLWRRCHPQDLNTTEWREQMRKLEPLNPPKFRNKQMSKGAAGVCYPEPKTIKLAVVRRRAAK
jgi:hypothetical protein